MKSEKYEKSLQRLEKEIEQKEEQEILRDYPLSPKPIIEQSNHILTPSEIKDIVSPTQKQFLSLVSPL